MLTMAVIRADSGVGELIVWLVVTIVWIIAQAITRARKKQELEQSTPPPAQPAQQPEDLDEFFKLLRQQFEAGEGKPAPPPAPPPVSQAVRKPHVTPKPATVASPKVKRRVAPPPELRPPPLPPTEPSAKPQIEVSVWEEPVPTPVTPPPPPPPVSFESVRRQMLSLKVGFSSRGLRLPDVRITSKFHRRAAPAIQSLFHGRTGLKNAVIARQVLGPPRSLRPWLYPED